MKIINRMASGIVLSLAGALVGLLLCEAAARVIYPPIRSVHWYHYDARYGMRHLSSIDRWTTDWGEGAYWHFRTNAHGFRGPEWRDALDADTTRVLVMGDSFTFGDGVDDGESFPEVADRLMRRPADSSDAHWEVLNLGVSAWGPQNALGYLETEGTKIQASCLVYAFFLGNDVMDNVAYHLYSLHDGKLVKNPAVGPPPTWPGRLMALMRAAPGYDTLLAHSQLFNLVRNVFIHSVSDYKGQASTYAEVTPDEYARALDLNDATLTRMEALAKERFHAFAIILLPPLPELTGVSDQRSFIDIVPIGLTEQARVRVKRWARDQEVPVLDLVDLLPHDLAAARELYFRRDFHMSAAGNRRVGELFAQHLPSLCTRP